MKKTKDTDYLCLSGRLGALEAGMLTSQRAQRLLEAPTEAEEGKILEECGFGEAAALSAGALDEALEQRLQAAFQDAESCSPDKDIVDAFRVKYDCHNLKVAVKCEGSGADPAQPGLMSGCGILSPEELRRGYYARDLSGLPEALANAAFEAKEVLSKTGDARLSDSILDGACFASILDLSRSADCPLLEDYARAQIDNANLRTAVRCRRLGQSEEFLQRMLLPGGTVSPEAVAEAWQSGTLDAAYGGTGYAGAAKAGEQLAEGEAITELERLCDNAQTETLEAGVLQGFGPAVLVRYLAGREREVAALRLILTGKRAGLSTERIRERMRDLVV